MAFSSSMALHNRTSVGTVFQMEGGYLDYRTIVQNLQKAEAMSKTHFFS